METSHKKGERMRSLHVDWFVFFSSFFLIVASWVKSLLYPASIGLSCSSKATHNAQVIVTPPVYHFLSYLIFRQCFVFGLPETRRLARQSKCEIIQVAKNGQRDPETLEEAERALQKVPNCSRLNHCRSSFEKFTLYIETNNLVVLPFLIVWHRLAILLLEQIHWETIRQQIMVGMSKLRKILLLPH